MKKATKLVISLVFIICVVSSFFAGIYLKEQAHMDSRMQRCQTLITFAIDKAESEDLSYQDNMEALISNIYAAYQFCDDPSLSAQLHDLWNTLIFEGERYIGNEDTLTAQLRTILDIMQTMD